MAATERKIPGTFAPVPGGYSQQIGANTALFIPDFSVSRYDPSTGEIYGYAPDYDALEAAKTPAVQATAPGEYSYCYEMQQAPTGCDYAADLAYYGKHYFLRPLRDDLPPLHGRGITYDAEQGPTWSRSAPMTKSRRSTKSSAKLALIDPQGRRITRRRCKPGHPARGGRSWVTNTITSPAQIYNAHPSPTMATSPPGCWHKSNGSRYTSPQNRLYPPPGEPGTVYGQLITTKTSPARPAQWAPPPGIRPHGSPQRHNATLGQL